MGAFSLTITSSMFFLLLTSSLAAQPTETPTAIEQRLQNVSNQLNKSLPRTLDEHTRQDTTAAGPGRRLTNFYTLTKIVPGSIKGDALRKMIQPTIVAGFCTDPMMIYYRSNDVTITYAYRDASGTFVTRFDVSMNDCR